MKRNATIHGVQWLQEEAEDEITGELQANNASSCKRQNQLEVGISRGSMATTSNTVPYVSGRPHSYVQHDNVRNREKITAIIMQTAEKKELCWNFDLLKLLTEYHAMLFPEVNFSEAAMLVDRSAQIYGRKVDYMGDIILHMNHDQKAREQEAAAKANHVDAELEVPNKSTSRKRVGHFNPQSLSDCFADLEFTCNDKKLLQLSALVKPVQPVDVDRRTKVLQMQDFCAELRSNPNRQRRQEILNRLRDDACIAPIMSSHGVARKNQIWDLESGETIGTRYDYQVHLNYIDGRTGSLIAEHDLKRFFQRCDVIDFLQEQQELEHERCSRTGKPAPVDMLAMQERELKLYMPPEYLKNRYRINVNDTSDFDNALIQARVTNYNSDPILSLIDHDARARKTDENGPLELPDAGICSTYSRDMSGKDSSTHYDSGYCNDSVESSEEPSFENVLSSSKAHDISAGVEELTNNVSHDSLEVSNEVESKNPLEAELLALEKSTLSEECSNSKSAFLTSRLSVDEGIGVDRDSPSRSGPSQEEDKFTKLSVIFNRGSVFPLAPMPSSPIKLRLNIFGVPEKMVRKSVRFALPSEYRKLKNAIHKRSKDPEKDICTLVVYNLECALASEHERSTTPDLEDFLGFEDEINELAPTGKSKKTKNSTPSAESSPAKQKRPSSPVAYFTGFDDEDIEVTRTEVAERLKVLPKEPKNLSSPRHAKGGTSSQPVTPTRTLSCDSGISDTVESGGKDTNSDSACSLTAIDEDSDAYDGDAQQEAVVTMGNQQPKKEHTDASNARIQQSMNEAKERFDKVSQWHRKLKPILLESEKRNHFDIHAYGTQIIDTFDRNAPLGVEAITLEKVLHNQPPHSTARFFLSMLMLANTNNVHIYNINQDPLRLSSTAEIELRLLSRKRHHKEMEALGELLPGDATSANCDRATQKRLHRKRKIMLDVQSFQQPEEERRKPTEARTNPSSQLDRIDLDAPVDASYLDNVQRMYVNLNSNESVRKRMAFRRGMRNCAYGLMEEAKNPPTQPKQQVQQSQLTICSQKGVDMNGISQQSAMPTASTSGNSKTRNDVPATPHVFDSEEDVLSVNLLTNHATLVPARDPDTTCAKSVFSLAESGYESMLSGGDI
ncbi:uncharacterized protein LOC128721699 [Anopheles nili]|uniref:uncharacterized protein LOC128721699 n=1 Tax=Anopheles nili TaxID=185578 RepID=UPI00237B5E5E|nr:uncharacterized protein LOC128721699 [Anopheles nili]